MQTGWGDGRYFPNISLSSIALCLDSVLAPFLYSQLSYTITHVFVQVCHLSYNVRKLMYCFLDNCTDNQLGLGQLQKCKLF